MGIGLLAAFLFALIASGLLNALIRPLSRRLGFLDHPDMARKAGREAVAYGGGVGLLLAFAAGISVLVWTWDRGESGPEWLETILPDLSAVTASGLKSYLPIAIGAGIVFLAGVVDDARGLNPWIKLGCQILAALVLVGGGVRVTAHIPSQTVSIVLTVLWVVGITNSFNLLDNMDGLSAGIAAIAAFIFAMVAAETGQPFLSLLLALLAGSSAGFLVHNFCPARLYLGDAGSYMIGFCLSALTVKATFFTGKGNASAWMAMVLPLLILAVPIFDTVTVLWIRLREGRPLWVGDRSHFSHRLVSSGLSVPKAVLTIYLLTMVCGIGALLLRYLPTVGQVLVLSQTMAILAVVAILEGSKQGGDSANGS